MEIFTILLFCIILLICIVFEFEILYALVVGLFIFSIYALKQGFSARDVFVMCVDGAKTAQNVLTTFFLIGVLTAFWRMAGTIPAIVCYAGKLIQPSLFLLMTFLLNCMVSILTGTAFGTAATMGVICATMGETMNLSPSLIGGAILSGVYFGDRCSPVSTSALLVAELTSTNIYDNIKQMIKTAVIPFAFTCMLYGLIGWFSPCESVSFDLSQMFSQQFQLHWTALLPAVLILILSVFRVPVKRTMLVSILSAVPVCLFLQDMPFSRLLSCAAFGYKADIPEVAAMINGGGISSMLRVAAIVCISSAYSGIFKETGLLSGIRKQMLSISRSLTPFGAMLLASVLTGAVACNQTLTIMLTNQLCDDTVTNCSEFASHLENTTVIVAPLIPWSIAGGVPLTSVNAPVYSLIFAFFLYLLPLWCLLAESKKVRRTYEIT